MSINQQQTNPNWLGNNKVVISFTLTLPVSQVCTSRPVPFIRWLATYFGAVEYDRQMIEIPNVGLYQFITSSDNTELEVGIHASINAMHIQEMKNAGARLLKRVGCDAIFEIVYQKEIIGLVRLSVVNALVPR